MINQYLLGHKVEVTDGKRIWYIAELSGFLMEVNLLSKELKAIWKIPNSVEVCSYRSLFYCDQKLYIFPYYQRVIYIYDLNTAKYKKIEVKKNLELMGGVKRGQFLYAFGSKPDILKFDLEDNTVAYINIQSQLCNLANFFHNWFWSKAFVLDKCIYIPVSNSNVIIVLDQHDKVSCLYLGSKPEKWILENIQVDSGRYYVIYCKGKKNNVRTYISEYDVNGGLITENSVEEKYSYKIYPFVNAVWIADKWICFPFGRNKILLRDKEYDEMLFEICNGTDSLNDIIQGLFYCSVWINDHVVCSINQSIGSIVRIDVNRWEVNHLYLEMKEDVQYLIRESYQDALNFRAIIKEESVFLDLKYYINFLCGDEK